MCNWVLVPPNYLGVVRGSYCTIWIILLYRFAFVPLLVTKLLLKVTADLVQILLQPCSTTCLKKSGNNATRTYFFFWLTMHICQQLDYNLFRIGIWENRGERKTVLNILQLVRTKKKLHEVGALVTLFAGQFFCCWILWKCNLLRCGIYARVNYLSAISYKHQSVASHRQTPWHFHQQR